MTNTYYLFGEEAVNSYCEGIEYFIEKCISSESLIGYDTFKFTEGKTKSTELAEAIMGWFDYCTITKEDYETILTAELTK